MNDEKEPKLKTDEPKLLKSTKVDIEVIEVPFLRPELKKFLIPILRRATYRWKARDEAYKKARVERGRYRCAHCADIFGPKEVDLDHVLPVVPLKEGFTDWNMYIERLFCPTEGFQVLCKLCHNLKTIEEDSLRAFYGQERKKKRKKK